MRFIKTTYKGGQLRERTWFLIFPKTINGETRWLEKATWTEKYHIGWDGGFWFFDSWKPQDGK